MSEVLTLDQLAAESGDEELNIGGNKKSGGWESPFKKNLAYPVEITEETASVSKNGYNQLEISLSIVKGDGSLRVAGREWVNLPVYSDEQVATMNQETLKKARDSAGKNLHSLLRAANPGVYDIYARSEKNGKNWKFFNAAGDEMSNVEKKAVERKVGQAVLAVAKRMVRGEGKFVQGKRCYVVRTESKAQPGKFFLNFYGEQPKTYELAEV